MGRHSTVMAAAAAWWLSGACWFGVPNQAGLANAAPPWRRGRNDRRRRGEVASAFLLIMAAAMLLNMPKARAVDSFFAGPAVSSFCQLSGVESRDVFKLPELGG